MARGRQPEAEQPWAAHPERRAEHPVVPAGQARVAPPLPEALLPEVPLLEVLLLEVLLPEALLLPEPWLVECRPREAALVVRRAVRAAALVRLQPAASRAVDPYGAPARRQAERRPAVSWWLRRRAAVLPAQVRLVEPVSALHLAGLFDRPAADHRQAPSAWQAGWSARGPPSEAASAQEVLPREAVCVSVRPPAVARTSAPREAAAEVRRAGAARPWALPEAAAAGPVLALPEEEVAAPSVLRQEAAAEVAPLGAAGARQRAGEQPASAVLQRAAVRGVQAVLQRAAVRDVRAALLRAAVPYAAAACPFRRRPAAPARRRWNWFAPETARLRIASP
jgi:hypothetical protein